MPFKYCISSEAVVRELTLYFHVVHRNTPRIATLAESPRAPAVSHRLSVIPISFNSALLRGLLAVNHTSASSNSKCTSINSTGILRNPSCMSSFCQPEIHAKMLQGLKATQQILPPRKGDSSRPRDPDNGFILDAYDASYCCSQRKITKVKLESCEV